MNNQLISVCEGREDLILKKDELITRVAALASHLKSKGIGKGDRVAAVLPNNEYALIGMLASSAIGAVWSSCSPDFGVQGIIDRFGQIEPKALLLTDAYEYAGKRIDCSQVSQEILSKLSSLETAILCSHLGGSLKSPDLEVVEFDKLLDSPSGELIFEPMAFDDPLYIMFSSGTTGVPKCIVHGVGELCCSIKKSFNFTVIWGLEAVFCISPPADG